MRSTPFLATLLLALTAFAPPATAQVPDTLRYPLLPPPTGIQEAAHLGTSVAIDGGLTVVGAPDDDVGGGDAGVVKIFDSGSGALLHILITPNPTTNGNFGISVGISGTRVVVGASSEVDAGGMVVGRVYVFNLASATPTTPVLILENPSPAYFDEFGKAVAIAGSRIVVGAHGDDTGVSDAGAVYIYDLNSGTPSLPVTTLNNPTPAQFFHFGWSVAISGTRVAVGGFDRTGTMYAGKVHVYDLGGPTPTSPVAILINPTPAASDYFGWSVAVDGTRVVVGTPNDDSALRDIGAAYVYDLASPTPTVPAVTLNNPSPKADEYFGCSVAMAGTQVVVGAYGVERAYVFNLGNPSPATPVYTLNDPRPTNTNHFGWSVAISASRVVVGAPWGDVPAYDVGGAHLFDLAGPTPTISTHALFHTSPAGYDYFGYATAISGTRVVAGAYRAKVGEFNSCGIVYIHDLASATPAIPVFTLNHPAPNPNEEFGYSVAIDGPRVVVGVNSAYLPGSPGIGRAGRVYVYDLSSPTPTVPVVTLTEPNAAINHLFGHCVAISGTRVVIGTAYATGNAVGIAYVYDLASPTPTSPIVTLNNPTPAGSDGFGESVAIAGTRVVVGAFADDYNGLNNAGSVYVYDLAGATPDLPVLTLLDPDLREGDLFGISLAISGTRVVVGARGDDDNDTGDGNVGSAYVFDVAGASPALPVAVLRNPSPEFGDEFGSAVAISGTRVVIGAGMDDFGGQDAGSAYVYNVAGATPTIPVATLHNPKPGRNKFGAAVAIEGLRVAIGTPEDDTVAFDKGAVYVFGPAEATPPNTSILSGPPPLTNVTSATFTFAGTDNVTPPAALRFAGSLDGGEFVPVTSPIVFNALPDGVHTFAVRTIDAADNVDATPALLTWRIDSVRPETTITDGPAALSNSANATFTFTGSDDVTETAALVFEASLDGGAFTAATSPVSLTALAEGAHTFDVRAIDAAGNVDASPDVRSWSVDTIAPETTIDSGPSGFVNSTTATFQFSANELGVTFLGSFDGGMETEVSSPVTFQNLTEEAHTFSVRAIDATGNSDPTPATRTWIVRVNPMHQTPYAKGQPVPSAGRGGIPDGAIWSAFGVPAINDAGTLAFLGKWRSPAGSGAGIFVDDTPVAITGGITPALGGATFKSFKDPVLDAAGHVAFLATVKGVAVTPADDMVLATNAFGPVEVVAREGAVTAETGAPALKKLKSISLVDGEILFTAKLQDSGSLSVTSANDDAAFRVAGPGGETTHVVREGDVLGTTTVKSFKLLAPVSGSPGQNRAHAAGTATFLVLLANGTRALVDSTGGTLDPLAMTGDTIGGATLPTATFKSFGVPAADGSRLAFVATLRSGVGGVIGADAKGIFKGEIAGFEPVARRGQETGVDATTFGAFKDPVLAPRADSVAFPATLKGATTASNASLWWQPAAGPLALLAREGAQPPGMPATGAQWKGFSSLALPGGLTGPLFLATLMRGVGGVDAASDAGVWAVDSVGALRLLFREGGPTAGKVVKNFAVLKAVTGSQGVTRAFNNQGQVAWRATFTDGSTAIVVTQVP